ncbi:methyltransferase family protein [Micromonospora sp. Llam0]|uniref:class I SAM-dependent methyltransferase n=1 Tax=Micromonospora sp. Llam0 TaxID=2485143 RepID=UPI000F4A129F|nr:class I SAM-dependent methyltransferase [Micromonospora sp. Llam0]ROO60476.1 methyltransferase family protein [Micromonospora sp. Llam0]
MTALTRDDANRWRRDWETMMCHYQPGRTELHDAGLAATERVHGRAPGRVLDVGGGPGTTAESILRRWPEAQLTVLDVDPALLALADTALPTVRTVRADIGSPDWTSLAGGPYDLVLALMTVHYLPENRLRDWYAEARQVLRPDGLLLVGDAMPAAPMLARRRDDGSDLWTAWWVRLAREPAMASLLDERTAALAGLACAEFVASTDWHRAAARQAGFGEAALLHQRADHALIAFRRRADPR